MARRKITVADICEVTGYSRDQLHGLLKKLPLYAEPAGSPRVAREFTRHDVLVLSAAVRLEKNHGLQRSAIAAIIERIHAELLGPRPTNPAPFLLVSVDPPVATYLMEKERASEGTLVALGPLFRKLDDYLDGEPAGRCPQIPLPFGPSLAAQRRGG
jgi:hypothetical protein